MHVVIIGGGKVGYNLLKILMERKHQLILIEERAKVCQRIADELGIQVVHGDGTSVKTLEDGGVGKADVVVIVTGNDEDNLVAAQLVQKNFDIPRVITRVNNPRNEDIFKLLGVTQTVSATSVIANLIEKEVDAEDLVTLLTFERGILTLVEVEIKENSTAAGKKVDQLAPKLPEDCVLICCVRDEEVIIPRGDTLLQAGDILLAVTRTDQQDLLEKIFCGERH